MQKKMLWTAFFVGALIGDQAASSGYALVYKRKINEQQKEIERLRRCLIAAAEYIRDRADLGDEAAIERLETDLEFIKITNRL